MGLTLESSEGKGEQNVTALTSVVLKKIKNRQDSVIIVLDIILGYNKLTFISFLLL